MLRLKMRMGLVKKVMNDTLSYEEVVYAMAEVRDHRARPEFLIKNPKLEFAYNPTSFKLTTLFGMKVIQDKNIPPDEFQIVSQDEYDKMTNKAKQKLCLKCFEKYDAEHENCPRCVIRWP